MIILSYFCQEETIIPAVREKVHFNVGAPGPPVSPERKLDSVQHVDYKLVPHFVVPQLHLGGKHTPNTLHRVLIRTEESQPITAHALTESCPGRSCGAS